MPTVLHPNLLCGCSWKNSIRLQLISNIYHFLTIYGHTSQLILTASQDFYINAMNRRDLRHLPLFFKASHSVLQYSLKQLRLRPYILRQIYMTPDLEWFIRFNTLKPVNNMNRFAFSPEARIQPHSVLKKYGRSYLSPNLSSPIDVRKEYVLPRDNNSEFLIILITIL